MSNNDYYFVQYKVSFTEAPSVKDLKWQSETNLREDYMYRVSRSLVLLRVPPCKKTLLIDSTICYIVVICPLSIMSCFY
jgi:hypothetical protein